jgi:hypothetical protein
MVCAPATPAVTPTERAQAAQEAAQAIRQMSRGVRLGGLKIKDLIAEGRW